MVSAITVIVFLFKEITLSCSTVNKYGTIASPLGPAVSTMVLDSFTNVSVSDSSRAINSSPEVSLIVTTSPDVTPLSINI
jgi:hypothetical protein